MTENEAKAVEALKQWTRLLLYGWNDVTMAKTMSLTEEFFSSVGLDWNEHLRELENEVLETYAKPKKTQEEWDAIEEQIRKDAEEIFGDTVDEERPGPTVI